jgi:hypothetical protein
MGQNVRLAAPDAMSRGNGARPGYGERMSGYSPDWTTDDNAVMAKYPVPQLTHDEIKSRIVVAIFATGQLFNSGVRVSGKFGGHKTAWYGKMAWKGHRNDAEIRALHELVTDPQPPPAATPGTCFVLGTDGPCDSCKVVLSELRKQCPDLEFKYVYRRLELNNLTQDKAIRYGWPDDKTINIPGDKPCYYHYVPAINQPAPLSLHVQQAIAVAVNRMIAAIRNNKYALKDWEAEIGNETRKQALPELRRLAADARERMLVAVRTWGERRRFAHETAQAAADNVIQARFGATGDALAAAEFHRRVMFNATVDGFGNWTAPE